MKKRAKHDTLDGQVSTGPNPDQQYLLAAIAVLAILASALGSIIYWQNPGETKINHFNQTYVENGQNTTIINNEWPSKLIEPSSTAVGVGIGRGYEICDFAQNKYGSLKEYCAGAP